MVETAAQRSEREWRERCDKVHDDMYIGDGPNDPPITTRLDRLESSVKIMQEYNLAQAALRLRYTNGRQFC